MEEIQFYLEECKGDMEKSLKHTGSDFQKIRAGKASPAMLDGLYVDYYGVQTPLSQAANVSVPDARSILIRPFERKMISEIEKAIRNSDLGLNPGNDGESIRLNLPPMTEDRRRDLVKQVKHEAEAGKVRIRNIRKDVNDSLRKLLKEGASEDEVKGAEAKVQTYTDSYITKIDALVVSKEAEIMTV
ncbi:MAG: ribosome recycling factor [Bacteroidota bacterium]